MPVLRPKHACMHVGRVRKEMEVHVEEPCFANDSFMVHKNLDGVVQDVVRSGSWEAWAAWMVGRIRAGMLACSSCCVKSYQHRHMISWLFLRVHTCLYSTALRLRLGHQGGLQKIDLNHVSCFKNGTESCLSRLTSRFHRMRTLFWIWRTKELLKLQTRRELLTI